MSDTLRERLIEAVYDLENVGYRRDGFICTSIDRAIAELDRLEAEVKKPRLPEGYVLDYRKGSLVLVDPSGDSVSLSRDYDGLREEIFRTCFSAFFPTPSPAETSDQGQRSQTPTKQETAEKPKPVSLVEWYLAHDLGKQPTVYGLCVELDRRTLDQER